VGVGRNGGDVPAVTAVDARRGMQGKMNRGFLIIAIPAFLVSIFWLTLGWGWHTAAVGACLELAVGAGVVIYAARRANAAQSSGPRGPEADG
jgi:hypothetical protein